MILYHQFVSGCAWLLPRVADHLWQATLGFLTVFFLTVLLRRGPARVRYILWLIAGAQLALPAWIFGFLLENLPGTFSSSKAILNSEPAFSPIFTTLSRITNGAVQFTYPVTQLGGSPSRNPEIYLALTALWIFGSAGLTIRWWRRRRRFLRVIQASAGLTQGRQVEALQRIHAVLSIRRVTRLVLSTDVLEPGVWGVWQPVIVFPWNLADQLSDAELETVLLHELVHVSRRDNLVSHLQVLLCSLFWFYPITWIINRKLLAEREQACDEKVLNLGHSSDRYAASLWKVFQFCLGQDVAGVSFSTGSNLKGRIEKIMNSKPQTNLTAWQKILVAGSAACMILVSVVTGVHSQTKNERGSAIDSDRKLKTALNRPAQALGTATEGTGTLSGSVSDASRARIPGATVVVSTPGADFWSVRKEITITNATGEYTFQSLPAGSYQIEVNKLGFRPFLRQEVVIGSNVRERIDVRMEVGDVIQTINITGNAPRVPVVPSTSGPPRRVRVGGNVQETKLISETRPIYPQHLQQAGIEGTVLLEAVIAKDGSVSSIRAVNTLVHPELVESALEAVKLWLYEPTLLNGVPIEVVTTVRVNFRLTEE
jgi:TonB family protein